LGCTLRNGRLATGDADCRDALLVIGLAAVAAGLKGTAVVDDGDVVADLQFILSFRHKSMNATQFRIFFFIVFRDGNRTLVCMFGFVSVFCSFIVRVLCAVFDFHL